MGWLLLALSSNAAEPLPDPASSPMPPEGRAVSLARLDRAGPWALADLDISGVGLLERWSLGTDLQTRTRPWWQFWAEDPTFVPGTLTADIATIKDRLEADGYYEARVRERISIESEPGPPNEKGERTPGSLSIEIEIDKRDPVLVCSLYIDRAGTAFSKNGASEISRKFPVKVGERFTQDAYQAGATRYEEYLAAHGHAHAKVERHARVDLASHCAEVAYQLFPGASGVFGTTRIEGLETIPPYLVEREITYRPGETYDKAKVDATVARIRAMRIFGLVRAEVGQINDDGEVPISFHIAEGPQHEIRLGIGYGTDDGVRGIASWSNYNFLGGNRRLSIATKISQINRWIDASLVQPHFPRLNDQTSISFNLGQQDESTYVDNSVLTRPSIAWKVTELTTLTTYMNFAYDSLSGVSDETIAALGPPDQFQVAGFTNLAGFGVRWWGVDNVVNPRRGLTLGLAVEVAGGPLGADFNYFRLVGQAAYYQPLVGDLSLAVALRGGSVVPFDGTPQIPLWARFYAGGSSAFPVRGYARRRVGPLSGSNDPIGGRSVLVGTTELLYPIFGPVLGVVFVDAGDVELPAWTFRPKNVQTGVGVGARAVTPVGPVELDFGFGLDPPQGDSIFQVMFTIGANLS